MALLTDSWLGPTPFDNVTPEMSIYTDEIFGPVQSVILVPMAYYSFGGWKARCSSDTHAHGAEGFQFFTRGKVVTAVGLIPPTAASTWASDPRIGLRSGQPCGARIVIGAPLRCPDDDRSRARLPRLTKVPAERIDGAFVRKRQAVDPDVIGRRGACPSELDRSGAGIALPDL